MTAARRVLLAAQILALGAPVLVCAWVVFVASPSAAGFDRLLAIAFLIAALQGLAGIVWSGVLIHNHVELRHGSNYRIQVIAALMTGMMSLILFVFLLPSVMRR